MEHAFVVGSFLGPACKEVADAIRPRVGAFHRPAARLLPGLLFGGLLSARADVCHEAKSLCQPAHLLKVIALSKQRCCGASTVGLSRSTGMIQRVSTNSLQSFLLAPATAKPTGTPLASFSNERLVPLLAAIHRLGLLFFPARGAMVIARSMESQLQLMPLKASYSAKLPARSRLVPTTPGSGRVPWKKGRGLWRKACSAGSRCAAQRKCRPRTPDPARRTVRRRSDVCSDARPAAVP